MNYFHRNLCAADFCAEFTNATIGEFSRHWDRLDAKSKAVSNHYLQVVSIAYTVCLLKRRCKCERGQMSGARMLRLN